MTIENLKRFLELKKELFGNNTFVEVNNKDKNWKEYNILIKDYLKMINTI
jgi:hypothetical protein